ncbi:MAG TPA: hypothetical protein VNT99_05030 [Methylomirabilota bacterium]|nr:hypothetical protein [Methylomirabilota bacterium]
MNAVTLKAHFDGKQICLDEPFSLKPHMRLLVTVIPSATEEDERMAWLAASQANFARAYGENEPDYSNTIVRPQPVRP